MISKKDIYYVRYSDDILILGRDKSMLMDLLKEIKLYLGKLGLMINEEKSICLSLEDGVNFLGYRFSDKGKSIPQKAKESLQERLETMWLTTGFTMEEKLQKAKEIIGGWEQYFREDREIATIFEYVTILALTQNKEECYSRLKNQRRSLTNIYQDIAIYLANVWRQSGDLDLELLEYEQFYQIWSGSEKEYSEELLLELLSFYRQVIIVETEELLTQIMQCYTDLQQYEKASFWMNMRESCSHKFSKHEPFVLNMNTKDEVTELKINQRAVQMILRTFVGREDVYGVEELAYGQKRKTEEKLLPLTEKILREHLEGNLTVGTYIQRPNSTVHYMVIDVDISKKILIQIDRNSEQFFSYLLKARQVSENILNLYQQLGLKGYVEYSGYRGYHVWLLFTEWIPVRYANMLAEVLQRMLLNTDDDVTLEFFPNKTRIKAGKLGQVIKLPFGYHIKTGERSYFVDGDKVCTDIAAFLDTLARFPLSAVKKVLAANSGYQELSKNIAEIGLSTYSDVEAGVKEVLDRCNLMRYLCSKAEKTGYLTHFERLSVLYVFGHLGDAGKEFVHTVMSKTLNYQYNVTEKFIQKCPAKPISCVKLRDQYKQITAEYGCNCTFKRSKNCYPSPVLHAISSTIEVPVDITIPTSRTLTKENEQKVIEAINIHTKAQEYAKKILDLKKQQRKLDRSIEKLEKELEKLFDTEQIDCLEIDMGLLVRRKKQNGYEWLIEI